MQIYVSSLFVFILCHHVQVMKWKQCPRSVRSMVLCFLILLALLLVVVIPTSGSHALYTRWPMVLGSPDKTPLLKGRAPPDPQKIYANDHLPHPYIDRLPDSALLEPAQDDSGPQQQIIEPEGQDIRKGEFGNRDPRYRNVETDPTTPRKVDSLQGDDRKREPKKQIPVPLVVDAVTFAGPTNERQRAVVDAFRHAWNGYKQFAWGHDHLKPNTKSYHDWFGLGLTILDALDTLYIMQLTNEFAEARSFVSQQLDLNLNKDVNLFETTIRVLGGLLSAYYLTKDKVFLDKAVDLGDRLLYGFQSPSGIPYSDINLQTHKAHAPSWGPDSSVSEVTTLQLEFKALSRITGDSKYEDATDKVSAHIHSLPKNNGLVPMYINADTGQFRTYSTITLGARADSYYEYLLKQWLQTGKTKEFLERDFTEAVEGIQKMLLAKSTPNNLSFIGELSGGKSFRPKMDHLVCYFPSVLALGYLNGMPRQYLTLAEELAHTCYQMYAQMPTFLAPEIVYFNMDSITENDIIVKVKDTHNLLRPETLESLWYLYHITGNKTYQDWGWNIFQGFEKYCRVPTGGYTTISDVKRPDNTRPRDMMESFFLSETLKYLYLLFSDDQDSLSLQKFVFNSEGHPLPMYTS